MRPILVTGGQGFVGRSFVAGALEAGERVVALGRSPRCDEYFTHNITIGDRSVPAPLPADIRAQLASPRYEYFQSDLLDTDRVRAIIRATKPRAIVHLASALRDDPPRRLIETNIAGTVAVVDAAAAEATSIECIVLGSSAAVYGQPLQVPVPETAICEPIDSYGVTKLAAEQLAAVHGRALGARISFARIFNVAGRGQDERHVCGRFAAQAAFAPPGAQTTVNAGNLTPTRDFIDVRDVASALLALVRCESSSGAYNVCSNVETRIGNILAMTLRCAGLPENVPVESRYQRAADASRSVGDNSKLRALGWARQWTIERSIEDVVRYYRAIIADAGNDSTTARAASSVSPG